MGAFDDLVPSKGKFDDLIPKKDEPSVLGDVAKSAAIGVPKGIIGAVGLPGDIGGLMDKGLQAVFGPGKPLPSGTGNLTALTPKSSDIQGGIEKVTGKFYEPKTVPGEFAQTGAEFLSNPLSYAGAGGLARKAISAGTAAVGSEGAGQVTKGTSLEPYARLAGAAAGGVLPGIKGGAPKTAQAAKLTADDLFKESSTSYKVARALPIDIKPNVAPSLATSIESELLSSKYGFRPITAPQTFSIVGDLAKTSGVAKISDFESIRSALGNVAPAERKAAHVAIEMIDEKLRRLTAAEVATGDHLLPQLQSEMQAARANWAAGKRLEKVEGEEYRAGMNASSSGSGANVDNAMRQRIKSILVNKNSRRGFTPDEIAQMETIVRGGKVQNVARLLSKLGPKHPLTGWGSALGEMALSGATGVPMASLGVGQLAQWAAEHLGAGKVSALKQAIAARSPMGKAQGIQPQAKQNIQSFLQNLPGPTKNALRSILVQIMNNNAAQP